MANNNNLLFNAALNGALAGMNSGKAGVSGTAADYATQVNAAKGFATEVDSLVANDTLISGAGGVTLAASTAAITDATISKSQCMMAICKGQWETRSAASTTAADYVTMATACAAMYTQTIAQLATG